MGASLGHPARTRAVPFPVLPLAIAALLLAAAAAEASQAPARPFRVDEAVNVRAGRGLDFPRVGRLAPGDAVLAGDCMQDWCAVAQADAPGKPLGYVFSPLLKPRPGALPVGNPAPGTQFTLTPRFSVLETYDSNVLFQNVSALETRMIPSLEADLRSERTILNVRALAEVLRYDRHQEFDRTNREVALGMSRSLTELLRAELRGRARSDHSFESTLAESGTIVDKSPHQTYSLQPALAYRLGERLDLRLEGDAQASRFPEKAENDMQTRGGTFTVTRFQDENKSALLARLGHSVSSYATGKQDVTALGAGGRFNLTENLACTLVAGPYLSRDRFPSRAGEAHTRHAGLAGEAMLRLTQERMTTELSAEMGSFPGSGGENTRRRKLQAETALHLTDSLILGLAATWSRADTAGYVRLADNTLVNLSPSLEYAMGEHSRLQMKYDYTCIDDHLAKAYSQGQRLSLSLHLEFPRRLQ